MADRTHPSVTLSRCVSATQYLPAAILLFHLYGWDVWREKNRPDGWVRKSLEELSAETNLTPKQVKDGLKRLKEKQLIESVLKPYNGRNHAHYRTTPRSHMVLRPQSQTGPCDSPKKDHVYEHENKHENDILTKPDAAHPTAGEDDPMVKKFDKETFTMADVVDGTVKKPKQRAATKKAAKGLADLARMWRETYTEVYKEFCKELTKEERLMLRHLLKDVPPEQAGNVVVTCVTNWTEFCEKVYPMLTEKQKLPSKPVVGFFSKHRAIAINFTTSFKPFKVKPKVKMNMPTKAPDKPAQPVYDPYKPADLSGSDFFGDD